MSEERCFNGGDGSGRREQESYVDERLFEKYWNGIKQEREKLRKSRDRVLKELEAQRKISDLYKNSRDRYKRKLEEFQGSITTLASLRKKNEKLKATLVKERDEWGHLKSKMEKEIDKLKNKVTSAWNEKSLKDSIEQLKKQDVQIERISKKLKVAESTKDRLYKNLVRERSKGRSPVEASARGTDCSIEGSRRLRNRQDEADAVIFEPEISLSSMSSSSVREAQESECSESSEREIPSGRRSPTRNRSPTRSRSPTRRRSLSGRSQTRSRTPPISRSSAWQTYEESLEEDEFGGSENDNEDGLQADEGDAEDTRSALLERILERIEVQDIPEGVWSKRSMKKDKANQVLMLKKLKKEMSKFVMIPPFLVKIEGWKRVSKMCMEYLLDGSLNWKQERLKKRTDLCFMVCRLVASLYVIRTSLREIREEECNRVPKDCFVYLMITPTGKGRQLFTNAHRVEIGRFLSEPRWKGFVQKVMAALCGQDSLESRDDTDHLVSLGSKFTV